MRDNKETLIEKFHRIIESCQIIGASGATLELDYADLAHVVDALERRAAQPVVLSDEQVKKIAGCLRGASTMGWITEETAQELSAILAAKEQA